MLANIIYLYTKQLAQVIWFAGLLIGYWLILMFTSAPGFAPGDLTMEGNFASYVDRTILPGKLSLGIHDTVGFFNNIPAICTALSGILAGTFLKKNSMEPQKKAGCLAGTGVLFLLLAQLWDIIFPINKNMWSSSFVLHTSGLSLLLLALFFYIIDVRGYKNWAFFFKVIGMNSILVYISGRFINWHYTTNAFFQWLSQLIGNPFNLAVMAVCMVIIQWLFLYILYKNKIFLRV